MFTANESMIGKGTLIRFPECEREMQQKGQSEAYWQFQVQAMTTFWEIRKTQEGRLRSNHECLICIRNQFQKIPSD